VGCALGPACEHAGRDTAAVRLDDNPADNTALAELGQAVGAGARTLSRLFHDELGMTFY
jgi:transcriptional regulator GlxA family with amidase domain